MIKLVQRIIKVTMASLFVHITCPNLIAGIAGYMQRSSGDAKVAGQKKTGTEML